MVGQGNRVRTSRLKHFIAIAAIGLALLLLANRYIQSHNTAKPPKESHSVSVDDTGPASHPLDPVLQIARTALQNMRASISDYTATFEKLERIDGDLTEPQIMKLKIMGTSNVSGQTPLHVYLQVVTPAKVAGREIIWVQDKNDNKLIAHESGMLNLMAVHLDPDGSIAMSGNKHSIDQAGIENLLEKLIERGVQNRKIPDCTVSIEENFQWEGRSVQRVSVVNPTENEHAEFHKAEILFDPQLQLPISYSSYLWPAPGVQEPPLEEKYVYRDLKVNVGLTEEDFNPDNPAYNYP